MKKIEVMAQVVAICSLASAVPLHARAREADQAVAALRTELMTNPAGAFRTAAKLEATEKGQPRSKPRELRLATLERIQGDALLRLGRVGDAKLLLLRALRRVQIVAPFSPVRGDLLLSVSAIHTEQGHIAEALAACQHAYKVFLAAHEPRGMVKSLLYIASLYDEAKDYDSAVKYLRQARSIPLQDTDLSMSLYHNLAGALKELGRYEEAERSYEAALTLAKRRGPLPEAQVLGGLARTALLRNDLRTAEARINEAIGLIRDQEAGVLRPVLFAVRAQLDLRRSRPLAAIRALGWVFGSDDLATTSLKAREAHETAWQAYRAAGRPAEALPHLEALKRLDDEATKLATSNSTALMGARFDFANQELRIATLKAEELRRNVQVEREQARLERLIFAGAAAVTLIVLALLAAGLFTIRRSRNAVRAANLDLGRTNDELARALAARTEFLATTSHEIRTPLNGILGMTQVMLADPELGEPLRDRVGVVHAAGTTMRALVDDILDVAKIESGRLTLECAPFALADVVEDAARLWEPAVRGKGVAFSHRADVPDGPVLGDPARVRQVLFNLLSNATKFTGSGCVLLTADWSDGCVRFVVADTGVGIPAAKLEEVFESFRQADAGTTRRFGGTGLGLSICRQLARAMGGDVTVESREGEGSRFTFALPLVPAPEPATPDAAPEGPRPLLIVDPNPITRAMLRSLAEHAGLAVAAAGSAQEVLDARAAAGLLVDAAALGGEEPDAVLDRLAAAGAPVTLLWPADRPAPPLPSGVALVTKPVSGPELLAHLLSRLPPRTPCPEVNAGLVSRAA